MAIAMGKLIFLLFVALALGITAGLSPALGAAACMAELYNNSAFAVPKEEFSPYDKIFIVAQCTAIEAGSHTIHVNWINTNRGIIRANSLDFTISQTGKKSVYFWLKLMKKGPLASMFSQQDFNPELFGSWAAELYLDDELLVSKGFTIN